MDNAWQPQDSSASAAGGDGGNGMHVEDLNAYSNGAAPPRRSSRSRSPGDRGRQNGAADENPGNNLHVSGLSSKVDNKELEDVFSKVGRVHKASVVYDPHTRESRGFGFVTMETPEEADAAITALNATELLGKVLTVSKAKRGRARTPTPGKYFGPAKRRARERQYDPRPYDGRYSRSDRDRDYDRRDRGERAGRYDDYRGRRDYDRDRDDRGHRDYDRGDRGGYRDRY